MKGPIGLKWLAPDGSILRQWVVDHLPCVIGRDPRCDVAIDEARISRQHARLDQDADGLLIEDLGSTNGTFVDGRRIDAPTRIRPGQSLHLAEFEFRLGSAPAAAPEPTATGDAPESLASQTLLGFTGDSAGFPVLTPAFYEMLNQGLIRFEQHPVTLPRGRPYGQLLTACAEHHSLRNSATDLCRIAVELGEEWRLAELMLNRLEQVLETAAPDDRMLCVLPAELSDTPQMLLDLLRQLAGRYRATPLAVLLEGSTEAQGDWLGAAAGMGQERIRIGVVASEASPEALNRHAGNLDYLLLEASEAGTPTGAEWLALGAKVRERGGKRIAGLDSDGEAPDWADLIVRH